MTAPGGPPMATIVFHRFLRLVWRGVVWLDAWLIDHLFVFLVLAAGVIAVLGVERGIQEGMWGKTMITAWHNEEVAARNVEVIRDSIKEHNHEPVYQEWPWLTGQKLARIQRIRKEWREVDAKLQRELAEEKAIVPSSKLCAPHPDILLEEACAKDAIVYLELNSQTRPVVAGALARIFLENLKHLAGRRSTEGGDRKQLHVYIDEAGRANYKGLGELISQCRSAGIGLTVATQSPYDLDTAEARTMTAVLQNTATKIFLRQPDHQSAQLCANLAGTFETMDRTYQMSDQGLLFGIGQTGMYTDKKAHEYKAHPDIHGSGSRPSARHQRLDTLRSGEPAGNSAPPPRPADALFASCARAMVGGCKPAERLKGVTACQRTVSAERGATASGFSYATAVG